MLSRIFHEALLKAYNKTCSFTGITFYASLEAAHTVPWSLANPSERMDIRNGVLLNGLHHKLFDQGFLTARHDHRIAFHDAPMQDGHYPDFDKLVSVNLHGQLMNLPRRLNNRPSKSSLERHHALHEREPELTSIECS
ncbi:HNH endonuclease [Luteimonas sp. A534]